MLKSGTVKSAGKTFRKAAKQRHSAAESAAVKPEALRNALLLAAIIGFTLIAYSNSLHGLLLLDNDPVILKDARIQEATADHIHRILARSYWEFNPTGLYRPLTTLSYLFNCAILGNGPNPAGYHWFNLILHGVNIGLVYALGLAIFEQAWAALLLSAIWGLHPVLTEAVTNVVGRADLLAAFGVLAGMICYTKALRSSGARQGAWLAAMALAITVGMFSKEGAIVIVGVMVLYDFTFGRGISWLRRIPGYIAAAIPCLVFLYIRARIIASGPYIPIPYVDNPMVGAGFWTARMTAVKVIGRYFQLLIWPARLSIDYSYNEVPLFGWHLTDWADWKALIALIACGAVAVTAIASWRRRKALFFWILFFFITLSPASNLVILIASIMGERFLYLPSVGFAGCVICAIQAVRRRLPMSQAVYRYAASAVSCAVLIVFALRIDDRNRDWLDQQRFWRSAVEAAPGSYKARIGATSNMLQVTQKDWDRSISEAGRTLAILDSLPDPQNVANPYCDAGIFYRTLGDKLASKAVEPDAFTGTSAEYWYRKSLAALLRSEKILLVQDEKYRLENARRGRPGLTSVPSVVYQELGRTYSRLSEPRRALEAYEKGRSLEADPDVLEELASVYRATGDLRNTAIALVEVLAVDPNRSQTVAPKLVELYGKIDPEGCAITHEDGARSLNLDCPLVHGDLCAASRSIAGTFMRRGQSIEAEAIRRSAMQQLGCAAALLN